MGYLRRRNFYAQMTPKVSYGYAYPQAKISSR